MYIIQVTENIFLRTKTKSDREKSRKHEKIDQNHAKDNICNIFYILKCFFPI